MMIRDLKRSLDAITPDRTLKERILALPERPARLRLETPLRKVGALGAACLLCAAVIFAAVLSAQESTPGSNPGNLADQPVTSLNAETVTPPPAQSPTPAPSDTNMLAPTEPNLVAGQNIGADMADLDYASGDTVIFHGYFGLFVYDLKSQKIIRSLDLVPIGCNYTQGDDFCEVTVSADGSTVQLHPVSSKRMYVYTVSANTLAETAYQPMENRFTAFVDAEDPGYQKIYQKATGSSCSSYRAVHFDTGDYGYLATTDWTLDTLIYVRGDIAYRLFESLSPTATLSPSGENTAPLVKSTPPDGIISPDEALSIAKKAIHDYYGLDTENCVVADCFSYSEPTVYGTVERWYQLWKQNAYAGKMVMLINIHKTGDFMDPALSKITPYVWGVELWTDGAYGNPDNAQVSKIMIDAVTGDILERSIGLLGATE